MRIHFIHNWNKWSDLETKKHRVTVPVWESVYSEFTYDQYGAVPMGKNFKGYKKVTIITYIQRRRCLDCNKQELRERE